ncbi:MAG: hypothetical protein ACE5DR_07595 [Thermodesulfobacteriota bacterium]
MENLFSNTPKGFKKTIYISIAAHIIAIAAVVLFVGGSQKKVFFTPVYTVSLVEPARSPVKKKTKKAPVRKVKKKRAVKKTVIKKKAVKKPPVALKKKKTNEKELSTAISKIREKVRVSEEQKLIASKIEPRQKSGPDASPVSGAPLRKRPGQSLLPPHQLRGCGLRAWR